MKRLIASFVLVLGVLSVSLGSAFAAEPVVSDFETRRAVLLKVFELSQSEISDFQARLERMTKPTDETFAVVYDVLNRNLDSYLDLIESRMMELSSNALTLDGVRITADNFKQWREAVYDPGTRELFDFLILSQADTIFSIVGTRYAHVAADVERLRASFTPEVMAKLDELLGLANARLANARTLHDAARAMFIADFKERHPESASKFVRIENAVALTATAVDTLPIEATEVPETIVDTLDLEVETVQSLTKKAIDEITETYKLFLQMRELVRSQ